MRATKIVVTVGPASSDIAVLEQLVAAGVDVFRVNCAHGDSEANAALVQHIRTVTGRAGRPVATLADLQGPKLRLGDLGTAGMQLDAGRTVQFRAGATQIGPHWLPAPYEGLAEELRSGSRMLLGDGAVELVVVEIHGKDILARVTSPGVARSHAGINLPGVALSSVAPTHKDFADLRAVLGAGVDYVAQSFVRGPADVTRLRQAMHESPRQAPIIAKLERPEAIAALDAVIEAADAVMVARGDLGVEMDRALVPVLQKRIIGAANAHGRPVIVATEMLESMLEHPTPTRAEVSDVANAVLDGADACMLSGETANGRYPVEAVEQMVRICETTEAHAASTSAIGPATGEHSGRSQAVAAAALRLAADLRAAAIVVHTRTGRSARHLAACRPGLPILALSPEPATLRRLALDRGVVAEPEPAVDAVEDLVALANNIVLDAGMAAEGEIIVMVAGTPGVNDAGTDRLLVHEVRAPMRLSLTPRSDAFALA